MRDKKIWIFNAGQAFEGNPKWLFLYIVNYRKDITPYWFCYREETVAYIKKLGYRACLFNSKMGTEIGSKAGVYVVNQKKEVFQDYLEGITVLNLWHGVGCKTVEKNVTFGFLNERIVKKTIVNAEYYQKNQLFLVTSPMMEKHFEDQCYVPHDKIIRAGYPCCIYPDKVETFNHDILSGRNLPEDVKIAVYAPTYRDFSATDFFSKAIPDMDQLISVLEKNHFVLIFKMHPLMSDDFYYKNIRNKYKDCPWIIFWDNANDFYEIFDQIELAIVDYSSIFYDMLARGVKNFARYIFDYGTEDSVRDFAFDYKEMTCGKILENFEGFLQIFQDYKEDNQAERDRIYDLFWSYSSPDSLERIVNTALEFEIDTERVLPALYSFDVFDTLISRKVLNPKGVFAYLQDKISSENFDCPAYVKNNFFKIRTWAEANEREYYNKSKLFRKSEQTEITFDMIYDRIQEVYLLTDEQIAQLKERELSCEYETSIPCPENIAILKGLLEKGEDVVLISDMYLPKQFVQRLLEKADPVLASLPLYLSSDMGSQKTTKKLFLDAFHSMDYHYGKWVHYGDNLRADGEMPQKLGIETVNHEIPKINGYENGLNYFIGSYDAYQTSALFARYRFAGHSEAEVFAYSYASLYFVPYVSWAIKHALSQNIQCLYFISRDGHHLKQIADEIIRIKNYPIKTKYIYGSRKAWRIPSQINEIDEDFFSEYGNFSGVTTYKKLLKAADMDDKTFRETFPELAYLSAESSISPEQLTHLRDFFRSSGKFKDYLLKRSEEGRGIVLDYLKQEIDFNEKFAFVEYWGRGYTQTCLARLLWEITGETDNIFYYARSIYPSHGHIIRRNFSPNNYSLIFIEAVFANLPYRSVEAYEKKNGRLEPVLRPCDCNMELHEALDHCLVDFTRDLYSLNLEDEISLERGLYDYGLSFFHRHPGNEMLTKYIGTLYDSPELNGKAQEYAPEITLKDIYLHMTGTPFKTQNAKMSLAKSKKIYRKAYAFYSGLLETSVVGSAINKYRQKMIKKKGY